jgi:hypothetical protein
MKDSCLSVCVCVCEIIKLSGFERPQKFKSLLFLGLGVILSA